MSSPAPSVTASRKTSMPAPSLAGADLAKVRIKGPNNVPSARLRVTLFINTSFHLQGNLERSGSSSMLDGIRMPPPGSPYIP